MNKRMTNLATGALVAIGTLWAADVGGPLAWTLAWCAVALMLHVGKGVRA